MKPKREKEVKKTPRPGFVVSLLLRTNPVLYTLDLEERRHDPDLNRESQRDKLSRLAQYQIMRSWHRIVCNLALFKNVIRIKK